MQEKNMKKIFAILFCTIGYIGCLWLSIRATFIEWLYIKESFINFVNPFIHFKVIFYLLSDLDIYATGLCLWIGHLLMTSVENNNLKEKTPSLSNNTVLDKNSKRADKFNLKKYGYLFFFIIVLFLLGGVFFKIYIDNELISQNKRYESNIKELQHKLLLREHEFDELELKMKEDQKMRLLEMLKNEKDPTKYNKLREYYNQLSFETQ